VRRAGPECRSRVAAQPVQAVYDDGVAVADEAQQLGRLRAIHVPAGGLIGEGPVQLTGESVSRARPAKSGGA
jgi:hypothetical protein